MSEPQGNTYKPWHLLVFMSADNSLYSDALVSLRQLTEGSRLGDVKITVQFEGPTSDNVARYLCKGGKRHLIWVPTDKDPTDPAGRLRDFLKNAAPDNERIFLILWGHGSGLDYLYLYSDPSQPSSVSDKPAAIKMSAKQISRAALAIPVDVINPNTANANRYVKDIQLGTILGMFSGNGKTSKEERSIEGLSERKLPNDKLNGKKIDILGFDSCLMGMAEICNEVAESVDLVIASDEEIPKGSFPYDTILQDLNALPGMDSSSLSVAIVNRFMERYAEESKKTRISLSAYRLEKSEALAEAMKAFVEGVSSRIDTDAYDAFGLPVRNRVLLARDFSRTPEVPDYIDLGVFCDEIMLSFDPSNPIDKTIHERAQNIRKVLVEDQYILYHREAGPEGLSAASGLAVYFPQAIPPITSKSIQEVVDNQTVQHLSQYEPPDKGMKHTGEPTKTTLLVFRTGPSDPNKIPTSDRTKGPDVELVQRQLIGSEVLWCDYTKLSFNSDPESGTGWAEMVEKLITGKTDETATCRKDDASKAEVKGQPKEPVKKAKKAVKKRSPKKA